MEMKQEKFELVITADSVTSTCNRFSMGNLEDGDNFRVLNAYFKSADGEIVQRNYRKGERRNTNQTLPRLACQIYEDSLKKLSYEERQEFPVCRYTYESDMYKGIFTGVEEFKNYRNTIEYMEYFYDGNREFVIYCWNIFSTIIFVQECMKRYGKEGEKFILTYRWKKETEKKNYKPKESEQMVEEERLLDEYRNPYSSILLESKNIIFRGAPGTGKSYLAKEIAADIVSDGFEDKFEELNEEQKKQVEFVQFHPSYDYSDFVEGLRPRINADGSMGFELRNGVFKAFVDRARENYENSMKSVEMFAKEKSAQEMLEEFLSSEELSSMELKTITGNRFYIKDIDEKHIFISIPDNATVDKLVLGMTEIQKMLEADRVFEKVGDVRSFFGRKHNTQQDSYNFAIYKVIKSRNSHRNSLDVKKEKMKKYIFIIDEINRGEISKIFGELFFSIDPGYRGTSGEVSTQYANLHDTTEGKFYIPENVYIIGTMNDIDRSVESFDFAMRRRFRFIELCADARLEMLDLLEDEEKKAEAIRRMKALNDEIIKVEDLNENYQIGASYFLKLRTVNFDVLWTDYLKPLLQEYTNGIYNADNIMKKFAKAYGFKETGEDLLDASTQN